MFTADFASDFSGLTEKQIYQLEKKGFLKPQRQHGLKYYTFGDIYVLRVIRILKRQGIRPLKVADAFTSLRQLDSERPLSAFILLHDGKEVYTIEDDLTLIVSRYGQLVMDDVLQLEAIGSELERTRLAMRRFLEDVRQAKNDVTAGHT